MSNHTPIPIKVTYTNTEGQSVEKTFNSLYKASKCFSISIPILKELSYGGKPKLHENIPQDLKVERIPVQPKTPIGEIWHCDICNKDIKAKSRYAHITTIGHVKKSPKTTNINSTQMTPNDTNELNKTQFPKGSNE